ncbi:recombinase family protein [Streptomyces sp. CBMA123]|uniref:recombinase family protein n=1 Tax=Streptomyces sp. CBMA123 TaxID=1896313 RepID=UPI001661DCE3|nr:recombinase family protein [Streptomyces sp. CBMA123]MBD0689626.1 hypothetical protein [Streptomyces sp. CBMA123]
MDLIRNVLLHERISSDTETSTSIERQDEKLHQRAAEDGVKVVGVAVDRSVSGEVDLYRRPELAPWLSQEKRGDWNELWVTNQDRLSRSDIHVMAFVFRCLEWGKEIVILDDPEFTQQMKTPEGRVILHAKSLGPAKELERIKARCMEAHEWRRKTTRWPGGIPTFGYVSYKVMENGKSATYIKLDEDMLTVLHDMKRRMVVLEDSFSGVTMWLNKNQILTARDRARIRAGKPPGRLNKATGEYVLERWSETTVAELLTNEALLGYKKHKGEIIIGSDGKPLKIAEAAFDPNEWDELQAACQARRITFQRRANRPNPKYGVVFCGGCTKNGTHSQVKWKDREYRYYRCNGSHALRCEGHTIDAEEADDIMEKVFLREAGHEQVVKRVFQPGEDHTKELEQVRKHIKRLQAEKDRAKDWDEEDEAEYEERLGALRARRNELKKLPQRKAGWVAERLKKTYREAWEEGDANARRKLLISAGFRFEILDNRTEVPWMIQIPMDLLAEISGEARDSTRVILPSTLAVC